MMKYKVGDRVRIKSIDWYNANKDENGDIPLIETTYSSYNFIKVMRGLCGKVMTISSDNSYYYDMVEDNGEYFWTDEMIEGLGEEEEIEFTEEDKYWCDIISESDPTTYVLPEGYIFKDENGNVINATKIILEKKKKEYPKTFLACCDVLNIGNLIERGVKGYKAELFDALQKLYICRDAYWKLYGEEMGLGKPWKYDCNSGYFIPAIIYRSGSIQKVEVQYRNVILAFPTPEMRDAFYENFKELIESVKELL